MRVPCIKLNQDGVTMYLFKTGVEDLLNNSIIERYEHGRDTGYQRQPIPAHYKKISRYFMESTKAILPTAILGAISPENIREDGVYLNILKPIRIVDGQHRIKGLECLNQEYTTNSRDRFETLKRTYEFPVVLMVISEKEEILEIDAFISINSKGKKVNTNLAKELSEIKHRKTYIEENMNVVFDEQLILTSCTRIARRLSDDKKSPWYHCITLGDELNTKKPISINAFSKALKVFVNEYLSTVKSEGKIEREILEKKETEMQEFIEKAWRIVQDKWSDCFKYKGEYYNTNYNICKGIGVFPLYGLLAECIVMHKGDGNKGIMEFKKYLDDSRVVSSDWLVGGRFTGMSSGQSVRQTIKIIKNQI